MEVFMRMDQTNKYYTIIISIILISAIIGMGVQIFFIINFKSPAQVYAQAPETPVISGYQTKSTKFSPVIIDPTATPTPEPSKATTGDSSAGVNNADVLALINKQGCTGCHVVADQGVPGVGPDLNGLSDRVDSYGLGISAEDYVRQSIQDPTAFVSPACAGGPCPPIMPPITSLSDTELDMLVTFILSLPAK
ncbi:MAG: cytochrome c [Chloroflexi bacterium]|nr:MAG: cytochrome c [Chloroflexota bacterium]